MNRGDLMRAGRWPSLQQGSTAGPVTQQGALPTALGDAILEVWQSDTAADWLRSIMPAGAAAATNPARGLGNPIAGTPPIFDAFATTRGQ